MDRGEGWYVGISYWDMKAHLEGSVESAKFALEKAASLGAIVIGSPTIVSEEFDIRLGYKDKPAT